MNELVKYNAEEIQLIKDTICKDATDNELKLFLYASQQLGLNPLTKQVYAVKRWDSKLKRDVMTIQTGIDGFRSIAEASDEYEGQTAPQWCGTDGVWKDVWLEKTPPAAAKVGIYRKGFRDALYGVAKFDSYKQVKTDGTLTQFWSKMPEVMIAKVAESLALRKAFPKRLSGVYTTEEMQQADTEVTMLPTPKQDVVASEPIEIPEVTMLPNTDDIDYWEESITDARTLDELKKLWLKCPAHFKKRLETLKNSVKHSIETELL